MDSILTCISKPRHFISTGSTYIMHSSLTACTNQVLFFNYPLDVETPETRVDTIIVLFSLPLEWRQTVKSSDQGCLEDLPGYKSGVRE